ncbi:aspartate--tRNA ligase, mitochondrial [Venturia canescens]|uniref:aspartate--tRNA ligase, mitochondrial n=1 Tax=Venturia canescens TaxID=32260 RepID=UPI001C9C4355|nr:aspartate--tRNA ligase, mitochondrial [Venturia canescens]XP_043275212.1 aspartate--tRNA ligase, mitochondrial [Venturia canescens]
MLHNSRRATRSLLSKYVILSSYDSTNCVNNFRVETIAKKISKFYSQDAAQAKFEATNDVLPVNKFVKRSHTCGELCASNVGMEVQLCGWMEYQRMGKFITLRDAYGSTQLIIPIEKQEITDVIKKLTFESVLCVTGRVVPRPPGMENKNMKTGSIEVQVESLEVLNKSLPQLPFNIRHFNVAKESLQMQYRYLTLRFPDMQRNLRMRSRVTNKMREYLVDHCGFIDVETPTLFRRTPGGAQEFIVPTQHRGKFYSLVQSPQQFKQLLMIGGIDKYFQIARCYRDEGARNDRQPEFTQLDIEMSFCDRESIMSLVEGLVSYCWPSDEFEPVKLPIPQITFEEAYEIYGSEQPDLRIPYRIHNVTEFFNDTANDPDYQTYAMSFPSAKAHLTTSTKKKLCQIRDQNFTKVNLIDMKIVGDTWKTKLDKLMSNEGVLQLEKTLNIKNDDVLFITRGKKQDARTLLGKIRHEFANVMESNGHEVRSKSFEFLWVLDFPLFYKDDDGNLGSTHHPFTQPHPEDFHLLETDPLKVRGLHYDLVLNGSEIAGGSIRIHNADFQKRILEMLQIDQSQMKHLTDALASGAPPHGGIAFGLDRLISLICGTPSIRNVIAFPKTMEGRDLMSGAPVEISNEEKRLYHL